MSNPTLCSCVLGVWFTSLLALPLTALGDATAPMVSEDVVFLEKDGLVAVEAEHFFKQTATEKRSFHLTTRDNAPDVKPDGDPAHVAGASGGAYMEILPDTRRTHGDKLTRGENFCPEPGKMVILHYKVLIQTPGRYYVWVRAYSTGSEDNGLHVGLNGEWPSTGQRLQWCEGKHTWRWESKQRTNKEHCGEPYKIYLDIEEAGEHTIHFSMREDGFEFDKFLLTTEREMPRPEGVGPATAAHLGKLPKPFPFVKANPAPAAAAAKPFLEKQAAAPRAGRPLRPQPRSQLEPGRGEHPDHGSAEGHGGVHRRNGSVRSHHCGAHLPGTAGCGLPSAPGGQVVPARRVPSEQSHQGHPQPDGQVGARVGQGGSTLGDRV